MPQVLVGSLTPCLIHITVTWAPCSASLGATYTGEWKDDKCHGYGNMNYASGARYTGEWKDDLRHGQGTYRYADGTKRMGEWKDGNPVP